MEALALHHLAHRLVEPIVVHRVAELVAGLGPCVERLELQVHLEALAGLLFVGPGTMMPEDREPFEPDRGDACLRNAWARRQGAPFGKRV